MHGNLYLFLVRGKSSTLVLCGLISDTRASGKQGEMKTVMCDAYSYPDMLVHVPC